jgi:hypothetical protein
MTDPDPRTVRADDKLLDRLARGEPSRGDDVAAMLADWRAGLPATGPADPRLLDAAIAAVTPAVKRPRRLARASLSVAATVVLVGGGLTVAAAYAGPDSPLWPVTRLVYGNLAESRIATADAGRAVSDARSAANARRYPDAERLLATADELADQIVEVDEARRLRDAIAEVRGLLPAGTEGPATPRAPDPTESLGVETPPLAPGEPAPGPETGRGHGKGEKPGKHEPGKPARPPNAHPGPPAPAVPTVPTVPTVSLPVDPPGH